MDDYIDEIDEISEVDALINVLNPALNRLILTAHINDDNNYVVLSSYRQHILEIATYVKLSGFFGANNPLDCHVVDRIADEYRFTIIYTLQSQHQNSIIQVVTKTNSLLPIISLQSVYPSFNWGEREVWDMSGIFFIKHPDLRRILTYYGFTGHPLRKDFPLSGFREVHYEDSTKHIEYEPLELAQSYRVLNLLNPWSNEKEI